jgi:hypothetical protein
METPLWVIYSNLSVQTRYGTTALVMEVQFSDNETEDSPERKLYIKITMHLTDTTYGGQYDCDGTLSLTQRGTCTCDKMIVASMAYVPYTGGTNYAVKVAVIGKCGIQSVDDIEVSFDATYNWIIYKGTYADLNGYIWAEFDIEPNPDGSMRTAYYTVEVVGTDCKKTHIGLYQHGNPCISCTALKSRILDKSAIYIDSDEVNVVHNIADVTGSPCSNVARLTYSVSYAGSSAGWLTVQSHNGDTELTAKADSQNTSESSRTAYIRITPLDSDGNESITDCHFECQFTQRGTASVPCDCSEIYYDDNNLHITAGTLVGGIYQVNASPGQEFEIGYIDIGSQTLRDCMDYTTTNTQAEAATLRVEDTGNRKRFKLIVTIGASACGTVSSTVIRVNYSTSPVTTCWSQIIEFILPQC